MTTENIANKGASFCMMLLLSLLTLGFLGGIVGLIALFCNCLG